MSLDITATLKKSTIKCYDQCGTMYNTWSTEERHRETNYDIDRVLDINITHNLTTMADHVPIRFMHKDIEVLTTLYRVMWHPEDIFVEMFQQSEITLEDVTEPLTKGLNYLISHENVLREYNPDNFWGSYNNLLHTLVEYVRACNNWPEAIIETNA